MEDASQILNAKQETALAALLALGEVRAAAKKAGVGETTLWRWLKEETFAASYREGRRRLVEASAARLTSDSAAASKILLQIAKDKKAPASAGSLLAAGRCIRREHLASLERRREAYRARKLHGSY
jgi:hypothetical protein